LSLKSPVKQLAVIHDINFEHFPENLPVFSRWYYRYYFPRFARKASRIATVSEFSKKDIIETYNIPAEKIDIVYNGANESYKPVSDDIKKATKEKYTSSKPYFIFIGSLNPRKNLINIFAAYDIFRRKTGGVKLMIVGERMFWSKETEKAFEGMEFKDDVVFCGRLDSFEVNNVIASSEALLLPSLFEGFGIPIVEAFYCGTPVITSNVTSMPEVAGEAALLVDPFSPDSIAGAMLRIINEPNLASELIAKGNIRKELFTWDKTAAALWQSMLKTINQ